MYYTTINDVKVPIDRFEWVKSQTNGVYVCCKEDEGEGLIINGEIYHVDGRNPIDKPTVYLTWEDDITYLKNKNKELTDMITSLSEALLQSQMIEEVNNNG